MIKSERFLILKTIWFCIFTGLAIYQASAAVVTEPKVHSVHKRHVFQLCNLIAMHTNRGCLDYNNYGCFCGLGNAASHHVDAVDGCCRVHDQCYGEISCYWLYPQFVGYSLECSKDTCQCTDSPYFSPCAYTTCQCDLKFAQCLGRAGYNHRFSGYNRANCQATDSSRERRSLRRKRRKSSKSQWNKYLLNKKKLF